MDCSPHTLYHVISRIQEQMRCPQCASSVPVNFASIKVTGDDFLLLEVRCTHCGAFMVLHVGIQERGASSSQALQNASSQLSITDDELIALKNALSSGEGSFEKMFGGDDRQKTTDSRQ